jgi:steroid delta-isomerase-like uncharacterized protein
MSRENEGLVRRFYAEVCNGRRLDVADELFADDFVNHVPQTPAALGPAGVKDVVAIYQRALDGHWDVREIFSVDDRVFSRWVGRGTHKGELMGIPATGKSITVEALSVHRIADGRIAEEWTAWDALGLLQQIGAVSAPAKTSS